MYKNNIKEERHIKMLVPFFKKGYIYENWNIGGSHVGVGLINKRNDFKHGRTKSNKNR